MLGGFWLVWPSDEFKTLVIYITVGSNIYIMH